MNKKQPGKRRRPNCRPADTNDIFKSVAPAISSYLTGISERMRFQLVEITGVQPDREYTKAFLCPAHLAHVRILPDLVRLHTIEDNYIDITYAEWERIKNHFGYRPLSEPCFTDLITQWQADEITKNKEDSTG